MSKIIITNIFEGFLMIKYDKYIICYPYEHETFHLIQKLQGSAIRPFNRLTYFLNYL